MNQGRVGNFIGKEVVNEFCLLMKRKSHVIKTKRHCNKYSVISVINVMIRMFAKHSESIIWTAYDTGYEGRTLPAGRRRRHPSSGRAGPNLMIDSKSQTVPNKNNHCIMLVCPPLSGVGCLTLIVRILRCRRIQGNRRCLEGGGDGTDSL